VASAHGCSIHDLRTEHYGVGLALGDYLTAGAAAEMLITSYGANQCHFGVAGFGFNTLNNTFVNLELNECDWGVYSDTAYGWAFYGGSLGNNIHSFHLVCGGEVLVEGMRDEFGPRTAVSGGFITYGASTSIRLHVRGCQVLDQVAGRVILESIATHRRQHVADRRELSHERHGQRIQGVVAAQYGVHHARGEAVPRYTDRRRGVRAASESTARTVRSQATSSATVHPRRWPSPARPRTACAGIATVHHPRFVRRSGSSP
jgi:hypothetical protein